MDRARIETSSSHRRWLVVLIGAWCVVVAGGFVVLTNYGYAAAPVTPAPHTLASIDKSVDVWTLRVFAHPHCPCTRATIHEIDRAMTTLRDELQVQVVVYIPDGEQESWADGSTVSAVRRIPNTTIMFDRGGRITRDHGVVASGHTTLVSPDSAVVFSGGVTASRGHEGASVGTRAIRNWVQAGDGAASAPVFGCAILGPDDGQNSDSETQP